MSSRATYPTCQHTHTTGRQCGSPALRGEQFCYYHHPTRRPVRTAPPTGVSFDVPPLVDREDLQAALSEIMRRLADNTLDPRRAGLLLQTAQLAAANLSVSGTFRQTVPDLSGLCQTSPDLFADLVPR